MNPSDLVAAHEHAEQEQEAYRRFLERMDRVALALEAADDPEQNTGNVLTP